MNALGYARAFAADLLASEIEVTFLSSTSPGGDEQNDAHVHALPTLREFEVTYRPDLDEDSLKLALVHELLHVAFRHVGGSLSALGEHQPSIAALIERALEEDTESFARVIVSRLKMEATEEA